MSQDIPSPARWATLLPPLRQRAKRWHSFGAEKFIELLRDVAAFDLTDLKTGPIGEGEMATQKHSIEPKLKKIIEKQHIFFVSTAAAGSRINLSPKGLDALRVWMSIR